MVLEVEKQREDREVEGRVCNDGDAQKPAKRPSERLARFRGDEFGQLQARGKKTNHRRDNLRLNGHCDSQSEETSDEANAREEQETEKLVLRHCCRL